MYDKISLLNGQSIRGQLLLVKGQIRDRSGIDEYPLILCIILEIGESTPHEDQLGLSHRKYRSPEIATFTPKYAREIKGKMKCPAYLQHLQRFSGGYSSKLIIADRKRAST
jgi:hypothetical protein